jgi:hypothetical protein
VDLLRRPLRIFTAFGEPVWWGFVERVEIDAGGLVYSLDLGEMYNRVRVWYRPTLPNSDYALPAVPTDWADDGVCQSYYGVKELQRFTAENTAAGAAALRDATLAGSRYPQRSLATNTTWRGEATSARLICKGWWHATAWQHFEQPAGLVQQALPGGTSLTPMGNTMYLQHLSTFTTLAGTVSWAVRRVYLRIGKYGAPGDSIVVNLLDASSNLLATASIAGSSIGKAGWYEFALNTAVMFSPATQYKLQILRSGAQDGVNYYRVEMDTSYQGDLAQYWTSSNWVNFAPPLSLLFKVTGEEDTAVQLGRMLAASAGGQFQMAQFLPASSGNILPMWRDGKKTAREEIESLLELGSGGVRYLATVGQDRRLSVFPQPEAGAADYGLRRDGSLIDPAGALVRPGFVVAGVWVRGVDITPVELVGPQVVDPARVFVEAMEWDNQLGRRLITPTGEKDNPR